MTHPQLAILGYSEAAMFLRSSPVPHVTGVISIHGHRDGAVPHVGLVRFADALLSREGQLVAAPTAGGR